MSCACFCSLDCSVSSISILYFLAKYAYSLSKLTSSFHREVHVLTAETEVQKARLFLLGKVADTIQVVLGILGVETVENM